MNYKQVYTTTLILLGVFYHILMAQEISSESTPLSPDNSNYHLRRLQFISTFSLSCYWRKCKKQIKQFSLINDSLPLDQQNQSEKLLMKCQFYNNEEKRYDCENKNQLYSQIFDPIFYDTYSCIQDNCDFIHDQSLCSGKFHMCINCLIDGGCDTVFKNKWEEILQSNTPDICKRGSETYCPNSLKYLAQKICSESGQKKCLQNWLLENAQEDDPCYLLC